MGIKRTERGWAGHFICGVDCNWRRNTLVEDKRGRGIVISSVGALPIRDRNGNRIDFAPIGIGRYYETMVFVAKREGLFIEADVSKQRSANNLKWYVSEEPNGKTDLEAEEIHEKHVEYVMENFDKVYAGNVEDA